MKKKKFALDKPKEYEENTYIGTIGELQQIVNEEENSKAEKNEANSAGVEKEQLTTPKKRILPKMKRKIDPMHIPIRSEKKPASKKTKTKKYRTTWIISFILLILLTTYITSLEIAKYHFPKSQTIRKMYYPVLKLNKQIEILPKIQKKSLEVYKSIFK